MGASSRLLVIGPASLCDDVARALPQFRVCGSDDALLGVWRYGNEPFDGVVVSLTLGRKTQQIARALRRVAPQKRIVAACNAPDEPLARDMLEHGADDYVIIPVLREDLEAALGVCSAARTTAPTVAYAPPFYDPRRVVALVNDIGESVPTALERLAESIAAAFSAVGVVLQLDDDACSVGQPDTVVLEEPIVRDGARVGRIALARSTSGAYSSSLAARLKDFAALVESSVRQARERERWRELAWTDDLSGLRNRRYFDQTLDDCLQRAAGERSRVTVLLFDIDNFKHYNDQYGHDTGDELIREVAVLMRKCTREGDTVARYGGDEFAVIFWDAERPRVPGSQHPRAAVELTERFRRAIASHDFKCLGRSGPGPVTVSGGLASFPWNGSTRAQLLSAADEALHGAKTVGKNRMFLAGEPPSQGESESTPRGPSSPPRVPPVRE